MEVKNPSEFMLDGKPEGASGSIVACSMEGTRPILIEVQALVCPSNFGIPRRTAAGTDFNRVNLLMAVLEKRAHLNLSASGGNQEGTPVPSWTFLRTLDGGRRSPSNCLLLTLLPAIRLAAKRHCRRRGRCGGRTRDGRDRSAPEPPVNCLLLPAEHLPAGPRLPCAKGAGTAKGRD